jgi:hypothetical protein
MVREHTFAGALVYACIAYILYDIMSVTIMLFFDTDNPAFADESRS